MNSLICMPYSQHNCKFKVGMFLRSCVVYMVHVSPLPTLLHLSNYLYDLRSILSFLTVQMVYSINSKTQPLANYSHARNHPLQMLNFQQ